MTIKDIARLSGYSLGTVSRALNNHPDVSQKARERIMEVVEQYGFQPNSNAKHLKMQAPSAIAILVKGTQNPLFADLLERVQALLQDSGEEAYVAYLDEDANEVRYAAELCRLRRPKGLFFLGGDLEHFKSSFEGISVPCVLLTNSAAALDISNLSSFTLDDAAAAQEVIRYLHRQGHRNIGVLGGNLGAEQISFRRLEGVRQGLAAYGLPFDMDTCYQPCRFSMSAGYQAAARLLSRAPDLTAIFALGDVIALGAIRAICDLGLRIPQDISLVGYDDIMSVQYSVPRLTTIHQDTTRLAQRGVQTMLQQLHYPSNPIHEFIPFRLVERESVESYPFQR